MICYGPTAYCLPPTGFRRGPHFVTVRLRAFQPGDDFVVVSVGECRLEPLELVLERAQRAEDFVPVLLEDGPPELRVAAGDAGGIAQAPAGIVAPGGILRSE